jgi:hypothetical protein
MANNSLLLHNFPELRGVLEVRYADDVLNFVQWKIPVHICDWCVHMDEKYNASNCEIQIVKLKFCKSQVVFLSSTFSNVFVHQTIEVSTS